MLKESTAVVLGPKGCEDTEGNSELRRNERICEDTRKEEGLKGILRWSQRRFTSRYLGHCIRTRPSIPRDLDKGRWVSADDRQQGNQSYIEPLKNQRYLTIFHLLLGPEGGSIRKEEGTLK